MTLSEYRQNHSWQAAIELGSRLIRLAEELPAAEEHGLSRHLREMAVELPATIAADLLRDGSDVRLMPVLKLVAALELIEHTYPALDTADIRTSIDHLAERLTSPGFTERVGGPAAPAAWPATPAPAPATLAPVAPTAVAVVPETAPPEGTPAPAPAVAEAPVEPLKVPVT